MNILLVEDEKEFRECLATTLSGQGHEIFQASNGPQALEILTNQRPDFFDVICTDFNMPLMNGIELIEEIFKRGFKFKKIIIQSGIIENETALDDLIERIQNLQFVSKFTPIQEFLKILEEAG